MFPSNSFQTGDLPLGCVCRGGVAQLGERLVRNQKVVSSILITSTSSELLFRRYPDCPVKCFPDSVKVLCSFRFFTFPDTGLCQPPGLQGEIR